MPPPVQIRAPKRAPGSFTFPLRAVVLLLLAGLLVLGVLRTTESSQIILGLGALVQAVLGGSALLRRRIWQPPAGMSVITLYLMALGWLWLGGSQINDWYPHLAQGILLIVPLAAFAV